EGEPRHSLTLPVVNEEVSALAGSHRQRQSPAVRRKTGKEIAAWRDYQGLSITGPVQPRHRPGLVWRLTRQVDESPGPREINLPLLSKTASTLASSCAKTFGEAVNRTAWPPGRTCGQRWVASPLPSFVSGWGAPPAADKRERPDA